MKLRRALVYVPLLLTILFVAVDTIHHSLKLICQVIQIPLLEYRFLLEII